MLNMKKASLFLSAFLVGIVGYLFYSNSKTSDAMMNTFISDNTLVLIETNEAIQASETDTSVLHKLPLFADLINEVKRFDNLGLNQELTTHLFEGKKLFFAILPLGKEQIQPVTYLPLSPKDDAFLEELLSLKTKVTGTRIISHTTEGEQISEVINPQGKIILSFIIKDKLLIYSTSSILIEDLLLHSQGKWSKELALGNTATNQDNGSTVIYWNKEAINHFAKLVLEKEGGANPYLMTILPNYHFWSANKNGDLTGTNNTTTNLFFGKQEAQPLNCLAFIPNATGSLSHWAISDNSLIEDAVNDQIPAKSGLRNIKTKASAEFDIDFSDIYENIGKEIMLCHTTLGNTDTGGQVLVIQQTTLIEKLDEISKNIAENSNASVFSMQYGNFLVHRLGLKEFPAMTFGPYFFGFQESFYTTYKDHVVIANNLQTLQDYLQAVSKNDVWSSSVKYQALLKYCKAANTTLICDIPKAIPFLNSSLNNRWKTILSSVKDEVNAFSTLVYQVENEHHSEINLLKNGVGTSSSSKYSNKLVKLMSIEQAVSSIPFYLYNPSTKKAEVLVQGTTNKLYLVGEKSSTWSYQLPDKLVGVIKPIKLIKSDAQQFLAATATQVYLLIRTEKGFEVKESPSFSSINLTEYGILDDSNTALTLLTKTGQAYRLDKATLRLTKASSSATLSTYLTPISTLLINSKGYALLLDPNGKLSLVNAAGQAIQGFPVRLKGIYKQAPILEENNGTLFIRVLSEQGQLYKIATDGRIVDEQQLFRPNNEEKFSICPTDKQNDWVILRSDGKNCSILDKNTNELFSLSNLPYGNKQIQFYRLGNSLRCFALSNGWTTYHLYDEKGNSLSDKPLVSTSRPSITYSESYNKILINTTSATSIDTWSIKLK